MKNPDDRSLGDWLSGERHTNTRAGRRLLIGALLVCLAIGALTVLVAFITQPR